MTDQGAEARRVDRVGERQARYVVQKAPGVGGPPIPDDEPCLVIRGQDRLALGVIENYLTTYASLPDASTEVIDELVKHRNALAEWRKTHPLKTADR